LLPSANPTNYAKSIDRKTLAGAGIILAEVIGFFTIGEMIGRFKLVGYRSSAHHEEH
jgi:F-type H+-transporting ATPase subunit g